MKHVSTVIFFILAISITTKAQTVAVVDTTPFYRMSLEELMNVNVTVASQLPMTNRESPGILTVITPEEIQKSGARNLMELLQGVPGINFSVDVEGVIGIGVRGNWANEGKVLLLWDGIEMNEDLYSTLQFGAHYPVDRINRIEIIRGPGSAIYGGNAEYAVINVITSNSSELNGVFASVRNSWMSKTFGSRNISIAGGKSIGSAHINLSTSFSEETRSQKTYTDFSGNSYDMTEQSGLADAQYRMDFTIKGFSLTGIYDAYSIEQRDGYNDIYLRPYKTEFNAGHLSAKYELHSGKHFSLTPGIRLKFQQPWSYRKTISDDEFEPFNTTVNKKEFYINTSYNPNDNIGLTGGAVYYNQLAQQRFDTVYFSSGERKLYLDNYAVYVQAILKPSPFNIILGSRLDYNPIYGFSFVPRVGITKVWEKKHLKALFSNAFRAPSVENINASPEIQPERTSVAEIEAGWMLFSNSYITANIFDITTIDPIIYYYNENEEDRYLNENTTGTRGIEVEYKWKTQGWYASVNYAFYTTQGHTVIPIYEIPGQPRKQLSFPSHKINFNGNVQLSNQINISPSISYCSTRFSVNKFDDGTKEAKVFNPNFYANLTINFDDILIKGFSVQAACLNMLDEDVFFIQPYDGNHEPLPGRSREYQLKITYSFSFKGAK